MELRRAAWVVGTAIIVVASCSSSGDPAVKPVTKEPVTLARGFSKITVPLPERTSPIVVAAGDHVVVYGGHRVEGSRYRPRADGADYDIARGRWSRMPAAPFARPLYRASGVWTGKEVVVLGTPCGDTSAEDDEASCRPGTLVAAAYTPDTRTWRRLPRPEIPVDPGIAEGRPFIGTGVGWTGTDAVFASEAFDLAWHLLAIDPESGAWRYLSSRPRADATCVVGGALVAVETGQVLADGGLVAPNPTAVAEPLRVFTWDAQAADWGEPLVSTKSASTGAMFEPVVCSAGRMVYLPVFAAPIGLDQGALWYVPEAGGWEPLPAFGATDTPTVGDVAELGGTRVFWFTNALGAEAKLFVLPEGAAAWVTVKAPFAGRARLQALDHVILVVPGTDATSRRILGLLDPHRLLAARSG